MRTFQCICGSKVLGRQELSNHRNKCQMYLDKLFIDNIKYELDIWFNDASVTCDVCDYHITLNDVLYDDNMYIRQYYEGLILCVTCRESYPTPFKEEPVLWRDDIDRYVTLTRTKFPTKKYKLIREALYKELIEYLHQPRFIQKWIDHGHMIEDYLSL